MSEPSALRLPPAVGTMTKFLSGPPASSMNFSLMPEPFKLPPPTISSVPLAGPYSGCSCASGEHTASAISAATNRIRAADGGRGASIIRLPSRRRRDDAVHAEVGDQVAIVLVVVPDLQDQSRRAGAVTAFDVLRGSRISQRREYAVAVRNGIARRLGDRRASLGILFEVILCKRRLLSLGRGANLVARAGDVRQDLTEGANAVHGAEIEGGFRHQLGRLLDVAFDAVPLAAKAVADRIGRLRGCRSSGGGRHSEHDENTDAAHDRSSPVKTRV